MSGIHRVIVDAEGKSGLFVPAEKNRSAATEKGISRTPQTTQTSPHVSDGASVDEMKGRDSPQALAPTVSRRGRSNNTSQGLEHRSAVMVDIEARSSPFNKGERPSPRFASGQPGLVDYIDSWGPAFLP
jgi:hypothetical protein